MREAFEEEGTEGKVEVAAERDANFTVHLTEGPLHGITSGLHNLFKVL